MLCCVMISVSRLHFVPLSFQRTLLQICYEFDETIYSQIDSAYSVLGKSEAAMDQLQMHFTSAVHNTAYSTVKRFVHYDHSSKPNYDQLCKVSFYFFQKKGIPYVFCLLNSNMISFIIKEY